MNVHDGSVLSLEAAIDRASQDRRVEKLRRITDLFIAGADVYSEEALATFDRLLARLIEHIEAAVLAEITERLAPVKKAPANVVRTLARHDDIAVAGPLLARSERLALADLVDVAETKSQAHLMAISNRSQVERPVTDVLVRRGNDEVVRTLAANDGACFSEAGMDTLAGRAQSDERLAEKIIQRADVPHHIFCQLLVAATGVVRERLLARLAPDVQAEAFRILDRVSSRIADQAPAPRSYGAAIRRVLLDTAHGRLGEDELLRYAENRQADETIAALSLLASVPTERIDRCFAREQYESLLIICKAAGLAWPAARAVIELKRVDANSPQTMLRLRDRFERMKETEARQMVRLWRRSG